MSDSVAYFNGEWIRSTDLAVPVSDLGFLLGTTLTEKLRTFGGRPYRAEAHLARMRNSIEIMGWNADAIIHEAATAVDEFMTRNSASMVEGDDWNITLFVTPGKSADAMSPTVCVHGYPIPFHQCCLLYTSPSPRD